MIAGRPVAARRFRFITPDLAGTLWYDDAGRWVSAALERDGAILEYWLGVMRPLLLLATIVSASISAGCVAPVLIAGRMPATIATGGAGGVDHSVGSAICRIFNAAERVHPGGNGGLSR